MTPEELQAEVEALTAKLAALSVPPPAAPPLTARVLTNLRVLHTACAPWGNYIRSGMLAVALAIVSGSPPPFDQIAAALGKAGWFGAGLLAILSAIVKSPTSLAQLLAQATPEAKAAAHTELAIAHATVTNEPKAVNGLSSVTAGISSAAAEAAPKGE